MFAMQRFRFPEKKGSFIIGFHSFFHAAKYASSFFVIIFSSITYATTEQYSKSLENPFFYLWIVSAIVSSFFAYGWDIFMDWGLMTMDGENKFLRDEIVYSSGVSFRLLRIDLVCSQSAKTGNGKIGAEKAFSDLLPKFSIFNNMENLICFKFRIDTGLSISAAGGKH